jgi:hypothetical protein
VDSVVDGPTYGRHILSDMTSNRLDFTKPLLNKHLDNMPDGTTYGRHLISDMTSNRMDFSKALLNKHLDNIPDGPTYGRHVVSDMTSNRIDFSKGLLNKHLDNMPDGTTYGRHVVSDMTSNRIDFSKPLLNKNLDNMPDGTRAAWTSTTQKNAAVDASGNLLLKNVVGATPTTNGPSTTSSTYSVIPEMTQTITTKGNKVMLLFSITASCNISTSGAFAFFRDGTQISQDMIFQNASNAVYSMQYIDPSPTAASHIYDVRWKSTNNVNIVSGNTTLRAFQAVELG